MSDLVYCCHIFENVTNHLMLKDSFNVKWILFIIYYNNQLRKQHCILMTDYGRFWVLKGFCVLSHYLSILTKDCKQLSKKKHNLDFNPPYNFIFQCIP